MLIYTNKRKFLRKKKSSIPTEVVLVHQHGHRFIFLEHQYGHRDVMWIRSIGESLLTSLRFSSLAYALNHRSRGRIYELNAKVERAVKLSNLCNFQLFASDIEGNISHQKLRNCWVAKKLMSHTFSVKFRVFRREFLRNHSVYWAQIFRDNWNCYALSIFRVFILLASSDSDKHMLMRQKV